MSDRLRRFDFASEPRVARWNRAFGVDPAGAHVELDGATLRARFGPWTLATDRRNVRDAVVTGPYRWWKVAGPAHLSLADRGLTFATTTVRGVCIRFHDAVPGLVPWAGLRHPALTVTVADPEGLVGALRAGG